MNEPIARMGGWLRQTHNQFLIAALVFGVIFSLMTPPLWGTDETSHFARAYQIAQGEINPQKDKNNYGGEIPKNLDDLINYTIGDLVDNKTNVPLSARHDVDNISSYKNYTVQHFSKEQATYAQTASYSPVAYIGPILGIVAANALHMSIGHTILLARLGSLFVYIALVYIALRILKDTKIKILAFVIALLPICIFQASVVTADNITIGLAILFIASYMRLLVKHDARMGTFVLTCLLASGVLLPLVKLNYIFLTAGLLFLPTKVFASKKMSIILKSSAVILTTALSIIWAAISKVAANPPVTQRPDGLEVDIHAQMLFVLHHPISFIIDMIRTIVYFGDGYVYSATTMVGWNYVTPPLIVTLIAVIVLTIGALYVRKESRELKLFLFILSGLSIVGIVSIFGVLYLAFTPVGYHNIQGVQGRYFIPFFIPIFMLAAYYIPININVSKKFEPYIFTIPIVLILMASVATYYLAVYG